MFFVFFCPKSLSFLVVIGVVLIQATGAVLVGAAGYVLLASVILAVALVGLRIGVRLFDREAILTRWR